MWKWDKYQQCDQKASTTVCYTHLEIQIKLCVCVCVCPVPKILGACSHCCVCHPSAYIGQQDGKQLLWTKQHSDATCSPAVFLVQFFLFNPSKEIKEQHFHISCPPAVSVTLAKRGRLCLFIKGTQRRFILIDNNDKYCRFLLALHSVTGQSWSLAAAAALHWPLSVPAGMGPG